VHPAESGAGLAELKVASNGLLEFELKVRGKPPDSTEVHQSIFSRSAVSALDKLNEVYGRLRQWSEEQSGNYHHDGLHGQAGQSFSLTAGKVHCGDDNESFEIPTDGRMQGTIAFSPKATLEVVRRELEATVARIVREDPWLSRGNLSLAYGDRIAESAESELDSRLIRDTVEIVRAFTGRTPRFFYGHSMSDIRYPLLDWKAKSAYGIGPLAGNIGRADEWVDREEYFLGIAVLAGIIDQVC
jgi:acetylornithine deacetylase/succinyl-diaminopimelate desuccinylase-like protein